MNETSTQQNILSKEERRRQNRERYEEAGRGEKRKKILKKTIILLVVIGLVLLGIRWGINQFPKGPDRSRNVPILGREHIPERSAHYPYNSNPPTSGPHYSQPANTGFYAQELPDETVVHNLEHGHIWISFRPALSADFVNELKNFADGSVIVTPRSKNDADIALAAWGRLDTFNIENGALDTQRIQDFILRYQNQGPENPNISGHL